MLTRPPISLLIISAAAVLKKTGIMQSIARGGHGWQMMGTDIDVLRLLRASPEMANHNRIHPQGHNLRPQRQRQCLCSNCKHCKADEGRDADPRHWCHIQPIIHATHAAQHNKYVNPSSTCFAIATSSGGGGRPRPSGPICNCQLRPQKQPKNKELGRRETQEMDSDCHTHGSTAIWVTRAQIHSEKEEVSRF
jgi:hypothetical protein